MRVAVLLLGLVAGGAAWAGDGGQPAAWTKLALGARIAGLGQAAIALADDPGAALLNPALAATQEGANLGSQAAFLPDGRHLHYLGMALRLGARSPFAWSLGYAQHGADQPLERRRGNTGDPEGTFKEGASLGQLGLAAWLVQDRLAAGLALKMLSHGLGDASAQGLAGDVGLVFRALPWLDLGFGARDVAGRLVWSTGHQETLPLRLRGGLHARAWEGRLGLLAELEGRQQQALRPRSGLEFWAWPARLALRAGHDGALPAAGLGLRWPWMGWRAGLDYALASDGLGLTDLQHRFSFELTLPL